MGKIGSRRSLAFQSSLPHFALPEFSVVRQHEEFIWLHDAYVENEEYAGLIVRRGWAGLGWEGGNVERTEGRDGPLVPILL